MNIGEYKVMITKIIVIALLIAFVISIIAVAVLPVVLAIYKSLYWLFMYVAYLPILFTMYFKKG